MATRFYFAGAATPSISPAVASGWNASAGLLRRKLLTATSAGEALATLSATSGGTLPVFVQYVSDPLATQTISGTIKLQMRASDVGAVGMNDALAARVVSGDGATDRGVLLSVGFYKATSVFPTTLRNKTFADGDAVTSVNVQNGDRLVIEVGFFMNSSNTMTVSSGAPTGSSDLPEDETTLTALVPWVELSGTIALSVGSAGGLKLLGVGN